MAGCGCGSDTPDVGRALALFQSLIGSPGVRPRYAAPATVRTRAFAATARAYWLCGIGEGPPNARFMAVAAHNDYRGPAAVNSARELDQCAALLHAAAAVAHGLQSPAVLNIGRAAPRILRAAPEPVDPELVEGLLAAVCAADRDVAAREARRAERVAEDPAAYACAAEGCRVQGRRRSALRRCSGMCPHDMKPHYCSRGCQRKVSGSRMGWGLAGRGAYEGSNFALTGLGPT